MLLFVCVVLSFFLLAIYQPSREGANLERSTERLIGLVGELGKKHPTRVNSSAHHTTRSVANICFLCTCDLSLLQISLVVKV